MAFIYAMTDTWNNNATNFDAIRMSVTDTTSGAASNLLNLLINGTSVFSVTKEGLLNLPDVGLRFGGVTTRAIFKGVTNGSHAIITAVDQGNGNFAVVQAGTVLTAVGGGYGFISQSEMLFGTIDTNMRRAAAGLIEFNNGVAESYIHTVMFTTRTVGVTFASLPTPASVSVGGRAMITNGAAATFNTTAAGGGANVVPVFSDGTQWKYG